MRNLLLVFVLALAVSNSSDAGYFEYNQSSYSSTVYASVTDNDAPADTVVNIGDIVKIATIFNYTDINSQSRTALGIAFAEVSAHSSTSYTFAKPTTDTLSAFFTANSIDVAGLESVGGGSASNAVFALMSRAGSYNINNLGASGGAFNFTSSSLGLNSGDWTVDMLAGFDGADDLFTFNSGALGQSSLDTQYPNGTTVSDPTNSTFSGAFGLTTLAVRDDTDRYSGQSLPESSFVNSVGTQFDANVGTLNVISWNYSNTGPAGTNLVSSNNTFVFPNPQAVPEPSALLALTAVFGVCAIRRRRGK